MLIMARRAREHQKIIYREQGLCMDNHGFSRDMLHASSMAHIDIQRPDQDPIEIFPRQPPTLPRVIGIKPWEKKPSSSIRNKSAFDRVLQGASVCTYILQLVTHETTFVGDLLPGRLCVGLFA